MLRSWNKTTEVGLFPDQIWLQQARRFPLRPLTSQRWPCSAPSPKAAVQALLQHQQVDVPNRGQLTGVISNHWFRFGVLPWALQSGDDEEDRLRAIAQLEAATPDPRLDTSLLPTRALIALAPARFERDRLFVAPTQELALALKELQNAGLTMDHWQPWAFAVLEKLQGTLPSSCILAVLEDGAATLLRCEADWPEDVSTRRYQAGDTGSLSSLLRTETLRTQRPIVICADALPTSLPEELLSMGKVVRGLLAGFSAIGPDSARNSPPPRKEAAT